MPHRGEDLIFEVVQVAVDRRGRSPHIIGIMQLVNLEMAPGIGDGCLSYPSLGRIDLGATPPDVIAPTVSITSPATKCICSGG